MRLSLCMGWLVRGCGGPAQLCFFSVYYRYPERRERRERKREKQKENGAERERNRKKRIKE